ncbi:Histocompatibility 2, M region locus 11 [Apodemus speciosus]|uniref:Histocompatibility 2, M region locus 11 n=1 Tax=Apodemus speciosus TaxID=105296 RepID=A0ABQ0FP53_APOSI
MSGLGTLLTVLRIGTPKIMEAAGSRGMKTFVIEALLLLLLAVLALASHPEVDFPGMEHCAPWRDHQKPEYWKERALGDIHFMRQLLQLMLHTYNYSAIGYHTIQRRYGCHALPRGYFSHGFLELAFNGHDYIMLNEDLRTWTTVGKTAEILRQQWEKYGFAQSMKNYLEVDCVDSLLTELQYGKEILLRTEPPKIHVIRKARPDRKITLRCWALSFYPSEITLTWERDGYDQIQYIEVVETRPAGDGTFQKWAAVVVSSGEEQRYTCHVNHKGLPEVVTLRWEPPETTVPFLSIVIAVVLGALLMGAVMTFLIWKRKTRVRESCHMTANFIHTTAIHTQQGHGGQDHCQSSQLHSKYLDPSSNICDL